MKRRETRDESRQRHTRTTPRGRAPFGDVRSVRLRSALACGRRTAVAGYNARHRHQRAMEVARVRLLGRSQMVPLNASAFVILTGNGLTVSEDLARRFVAVDFDARTEDPELRPFATDIRVEVTQRRMREIEDWHGYDFRNMRR